MKFLHIFIRLKCLFVNTAASANIWDRSVDINTFEYLIPIARPILLLHIKSN